MTTVIPLFVVGSVSFNYILNIVTHPHLKTDASKIMLRFKFKEDTKDAELRLSSDGETGVFGIGSMVIYREMEYKDTKGLE